MSENTLIFYDKSKRINEEFEAVGVDRLSMTVEQFPDETNEYEAICTTEVYVNSTCKRTQIIRCPVTSQSYSTVVILKDAICDSLRKCGLYLASVDDAVELVLDTFYDFREPSAKHNLDKYETKQQCKDENICQSEQ